MTIPGFTSTGSKRSDALFGMSGDGPRQMVRAEGCRIWDVDGNEYLDMSMALGAVALGYGHPSVIAAVQQAVRDGVVGSLPPLLETDVAARLATVIPGTEAVRFFKTGAEAVAAAVRIARVVTGRDRVISCGYHGWLDWCQHVEGVPEDVQALHRDLPFNDVAALRGAIAGFGPVAAVVIEPVVDQAPREAWLRSAREAATADGAVLVFDEIKTALRLATGGIAERTQIVPDIVVVGKALGNGLPIAAICGSNEVMNAVTRTWISSTLATEYASLAAAQAVLETFEREPVVEHLERVGCTFFEQLTELAQRHAELVAAVRGVPQMCYLEFADDATSGLVAREAARRGLLFKRTAYNFVSLAHTDSVIARVIERLDAALGAASHKC